MIYADALLADAKTAPELSFDAPPGTYVAVNLDLDAPFPSFAFMSPILHCASQLQSYTYNIF